MIFNIFPIGIPMPTGRNYCTDLVSRAHARMGIDVAKWIWPNQVHTLKVANCKLQVDIEDHT